VLYEKLGEYGPDLQFITVQPAGTSPAFVPTTQLGEEDAPEDVVTDGEQKMPVDPTDDFWSV
jgi:hypothetical protein